MGGFVPRRCPEPGRTRGPGGRRGVNLACGLGSRWAVGRRRTQGAGGVQRRSRVHGSRQTWCDPEKGLLGRQFDLLQGRQRGWRRFFGRDGKGGNVGKQGVGFFAHEQMGDLGLEPLLVGEGAALSEPNEAGADQRGWTVGAKPCGHQQPDGPPRGTWLTAQTRHPGRYDAGSPAGANHEGASATGLGGVGFTIVQETPSSPSRGVLAAGAETPWAIFQATIVAVPTDMPRFPRVGDLLAGNGLARSAWLRRGSIGIGDGLVILGITRRSSRAHHDQFQRGSRRCP